MNECLGHNFTERIIFSICLKSLESPFFDIFFFFFFIFIVSPAFVTFLNYLLYYFKRIRIIVFSPTYFFFEYS